MCEIDLPLSGRKNDKRLFAHGNPLYFLNIICTHFGPALLHHTLHLYNDRKQFNPKNRILITYQK
jgi:hypothetical protein